jgi:hypothetical protein
MVVSTRTRCQQKKSPLLQAESFFVDPFLRVENLPNEEKLAYSYNLLAL